MSWGVHAYLMWKKCDNNLVRSSLEKGPPHLLASSWTQNSRLRSSPEMSRLRRYLMMVLPVFFQFLSAPFRCAARVLSFALITITPRSLGPTRIVWKCAGCTVHICCIHRMWMLLWSAHQSDRQLVYCTFLTFVNGNVCANLYKCEVDQ